MTPRTSRASEMPSLVSCAFRKADEIFRRQTFIVKNTDRVAKKYVLTHVPAGTAITVKPVSSHPLFGLLQTSLHAIEHRELSFLNLVQFPFQPLLRWSPLTRPLSLSSLAKVKPSQLNSVFQSVTRPPFPFFQDSSRSPAGLSSCM